MTKKCVKFVRSFLAQKLLSVRDEKVREIHRVIPLSKLIVDDLAYYTLAINKKIQRINQVLNLKFSIIVQRRIIKWKPSVVLFKMKYLSSYKLSCYEQ